ncbi:hypothetical protein RNI52_06085 [Labrys neptuniae]|uniref:hypothetical protein n=1 Tax=Labrys neptuniae TaxID=376174 RepID=UPI00288FC4CA|nr:hypothetical protein [Labrys neptuniae]MDT3376893.1 hypothetical protein [Labrys neptuniae]
MAKDKALILQDFASPHIEAAPGATGSDFEEAEAPPAARRLLLGIRHALLATAGEPDPSVIREQNA